MDRDQLLKVANQLDIEAKAALDRGLEFACLADCDPRSTISDFERAGSLGAAAQMCRQKADEI
jgi:hypothetical protein